MTGWQHIPARNFQAMPWRNGGGTTWEIARGRFDHTAGEAWHWRFSLAEIASDGPFSVFPHVDRLLTLLTGEGIDLTIDGAQPRRLRPGEDIQFAGEATVGCALVDGPTRDLNLMVDRRVAWLVPGGKACELAVAGENDVILVYALEDVWLRNESGRVSVVAGDVLMGEGPASAVIEAGRAVWARVERLVFPR